MAGLRLNEIPRYEAIGEYAKRYPNMDPSSSEAFIVLLHTGELMQEVAGRWLAEEGTSQARFLVMALLNRNPDKPMSATELSAGIRVTKQTMTSLMDGLEKDGMIERIPMEGDRRVCHVRLKPEGRKFMTRVMPKVFEAHKGAMSALSSAEQRQLSALLRKLWGSLEPQG